MPDLPPAGPQQIVEALVECGLHRSGVKVTYEDELQSELVVIAGGTVDSNEKFACIREASRGAIIQFKDNKVGVEYERFLAELIRPQMIASARESLAKSGKLAGLPMADDFAGMEQFARAVEVHCGYRPGEVLVAYATDTWTINPSQNADGSTVYDDFEKIGCVFSALMAQTEDLSSKGFNFEFIGNAAVAAPESRGTTQP